MGDRPYRNPRIDVRMMDGGEWTCQSLNPDILKYERTAAKHKWPAYNASPMSAMTFLAWSAGQREGHIPKSMTWEEFSDELCAEVASADAVPVDPTPPEPGTG